MKKWLLGVISATLITPAWCDTALEPLLNKVTLQLSAEQWIATKTATVSIGVNASVNDSDLGKVQSHLMDKLNQLVDKVDWHIITFNRSLDQSGLERIQATAQARVPEAALAGLRDKTKSLSKPGETFTLDDVQFVPSADEIKQANALLRADIYQQAKNEMDALNKLSSEQKYYLHDINFVSEVAPVPQAQNAMYMKASAMNNNIAVGDKVQLTATVVLAAAPSADVVKLVHN